MTESTTGRPAVPDPTISTLLADHAAELREDDHHWIRETLDRMVPATAERVPARFAGSVVTDPGVQEWVRDLVAASVAPGRGVIPTIVGGPALLLLGPTGTGKTHQAWGAIRALSVSGAAFTWRVISAPDLYAKLRPRHGVDSEETFQGYADCGVLVLDDIAAGKSSQWTEEVNYRLINHRYETGRATMVTSNLAPGQVRDQLGERVTSRLLEMARRVTLKGEDRRRTGGLRVLDPAARPQPRTVRLYEQ